MNKEKKVLITGINGFIGNGLANYYSLLGYDVIGVDVRKEDLTSKWSFHSIEVGSDDFRQLLQKEKPNIIFHCAGAADVNKSRIDPDGDFQLNYLVSRRLLYDIESIVPDAKIMLFSSAAVYGNPERNPITEDMPYNPISPYALHKVLMELTASYHSNIYNLNISVLRIFSAYGEGLKKQVFWDMGQKVKNGNTLIMGGTGNETRDFIYIDDLINAIDIIARSNEKGFNVFNIGNGEEVAINEIANIFVNEVAKYSLCKPIDILFTGEERVGNPSNWKADITRLKNLGYSRSISLEEGISKYVAWLHSIGEL